MTVNVHDTKMDLRADVVIKLREMADLIEAGKLDITGFSKNSQTVTNGLAPAGTWPAGSLPQAQQTPSAVVVRLTLDVTAPVAQPQWNTPRHYPSQHPGPLKYPDPGQYGGYNQRSDYAAGPYNSPYQSDITAPSLDNSETRLNALRGNLEPAPLLAGLRVALVGKVLKEKGEVIVAINQELEKLGAVVVPTDADNVEMLVYYEEKLHHSTVNRLWKEYHLHPTYLGSYIDLDVLNQKVGKKK